MINLQVCRRVDDLNPDEDPIVKMSGKLTPVSQPAGSGAGAAPIAPAAHPAEKGTGNPPAAVPDKTKAKDDPAPAAGTFNEPEYIKKTFGDEFDSAEKIKTTVSRVKALETEISTLKNTDPYSLIKDDYIRGLAKAVNEGVTREAYDRVASVDPDKLSVDIDKNQSTQKDAVVTQLMWKHGYSKEEAELIADDRYKLDPTLDATTKEVLVARLSLKADAKDALSWIRTHKAESLKPVPDETENAMQQQIEQITPVVAKLADSLGEFKWNEKDATPFKFNDQVRKTATEFVLQAIAESGRVIDPTSKQDLLVVANEIQLKMISEVGIKNIISHYIAALNVKDLKENHNPSSLTDLTPSDKTAKAIKDRQHIANQIAAEE